MSTASADRLRREGPYGPSFARSVVLLPGPTPAGCPGDPERPAWLWEGHHCRLDKRLWATYGIGCADYYRLLALQRGRCGVCGGPPRRWRLVVEHEHSTGEVRGLTHFTCNRLLVLLPALWRLTWQLCRYLADPPGRALGLVVPLKQRRRLEAKDRAKRERARKRAKARPPEPPSGVARLRAMTNQGGQP
jgi:Recombination endonuclease VII